MNAIPGMINTRRDLRPLNAVLFSGGLDSLCAAVLHPDAKLIRVATGALYDEHEEQCALSLASAIGRTLIRVNNVLDLSDLEQPDALVPGRNAFIALAAAPYAQVLMLASVNGDGTHATDKDMEFARLMSKLLVKLFGNGGLMLPYRDISKHALAQKACLTGGFTFLHALPSVWSCYGPGGMHCGKCKACVRLWAAITFIGAEGYAPQFVEHPLTLPEFAFKKVFVGRGEEETNALALRKKFTAQ